MATKDETAKKLAEAHLLIEPSIKRIIRLVTDREDEAGEPVKLLEVNPATSPSGIFPIAFTAAPPAVLHPSVVVEVTESEYEQILQGELSLPDGWQLGSTIYPVAA